MTTERIFPINEPFYEIPQITTFKEMIDNSEKLYSSRPAFRLRNKDGVYYEVTYKKFRHDIYYLGNSLINDGYSRAHIAVIGANSYKWMVTYLAAACSNNVIVPIDKELMIDNVIDILKDSDSVMLFGDKKFITAIEKRKNELPEGFKFCCFDNIEADGVLKFDDYIQVGRNIYHDGNKNLYGVTVDKDAISAILFTSGTTGVSKGVCLSQYNICYDVTSVLSVVKVTSQDSSLSVLPIHHTYECAIDLALLTSGACISFGRGLRYIVQDLKEVGPTVFVAVPLMIEKFHAKIMKKIKDKTAGRVIFKVGKYASRAGRLFGTNKIGRSLFNEVIQTFGGNLRLIVTGASAIDPRVVEDFITMGVDIYIGYGLTETSPILSVNNDKLMLTNSVGTPLPGVEMKIHNPDDLGVGEIWARGPMVMKGYYKNPEATAQVLTPDGWFKTGDLGVVDENNCYRITGRCKNVIVTKNGKNIFPEEVELYLNNNPFIEESMVYGEESGNDETTVSAQIYPNYEMIKENLKRQELTQEEIRNSIAEAIKEVNQKLPNYKKIMKFDVRENEFIKTTTKKIKRQANIDEQKAANEAANEDNTETKE